MKLTSKPLAIIVFVIMFGGISLSAWLNLWNTSTNKIPATYSDGEANGEYNPADIRGSYTFGDISSLFSIPLEDLAAAFVLSDEVDPAAFQVKNLETLYEGASVEIGTASIRLFVAFYNGLPYDLTGEETFVPVEAGEILVTKGKMTSEQTAYLKTHTFNLNQSIVAAESTEAPVSTGTPASPVHTVTSGSITGKTTFRELLDWGVNQEAIEKVLGEAMPSPETIVKDYATSKGLEFSTLKTALQAEIDLVNP